MPDFKSVQIVGFIGLIGSGKTYESNRLFNELDQEGYKPTLIYFADALRDYCWKLLNWKPANDDDYDTFKKSVFTCSNFGIEVSGRELLQRLGTEIMRDYDPEVWIRIYERKVKEAFQNGYTHILTPDVRFENEKEAITRIGKSVFMFCNYRSDRYSINNHASEALALKYLNMGKEHGDII